MFFFFYHTNLLEARFLTSFTKIFSLLKLVLIPIHIQLQEVQTRLKQDKKFPLKIQDLILEKNQ